MDISINGKAADITLESERTVGEVLSGLETWLQGSGFCLSGLELDGELVGVNGIPTVFSRDITSIRRLNIRASARLNILEEALDDTCSQLETLESAGREEQVSLINAWKESAAASFLAAEAPEFFNTISQSFAAGTPEMLRPLAEERLREIRTPLRELAALEGIVTGIISRLEDLPLDIQTGKDERAAETVALFSNVAEKIFRVFIFLQSQEASLGELSVDGMAMNAFLDEFSAALKELLAAYESKDSVLVGDLAEYELAPRLHTFYRALNASLFPIRTVREQV